MLFFIGIFNSKPFFKQADTDNIATRRQSYKKDIEIHFCLLVIMTTLDTKKDWPVDQWWSLQELVDLDEVLPDRNSHDGHDLILFESWATNFCQRRIKTK